MLDIFQYEKLAAAAVPECSDSSVRLGIWSDVDPCINTTQTECDFTASFLESCLYFCKVYVRVRAQTEKEVSDWAVTPQFDPVIETEIGPPSLVRVESRSGMLYVTILNPFVEAENKPLEDIYEDIRYNVSYWEKGTLEKNQTGPVETMPVMLNNLKPWTTYCLQVQLLVRVSDDEDKAGQLSKDHCSVTTADVWTRIARLTLILFGFMLVIVVVIVGCFLIIQYGRRVVKYIFHPPYKIPSHIEEFRGKKKLDTTICFSFFFFDE
uniref:Interferon/interleukin receptor domain-containing protein n=1 Tax=Latimeria chalumnae TaxID=7897 RepID=H2ZW70_LATCH